MGNMKQTYQTCTSLNFTVLPHKGRSMSVVPLETWLGDVSLYVVRSWSLQVLKPGARVCQAAQSSMWLVVWNQLDHTKCQSKPGTQLRCKSQSSDHTLLRKRNQKDAKGPTSVIWRHWVWRTRFCYQSSQAWIIAPVWGLLTSTKATRTFSRPFLPQKESRHDTVRHTQNKARPRIRHQTVRTDPVGDLQFNLLTMLISACRATEKD